MSTPDSTKNVMLDALNITHIQIHDQDPGAAGTTGAVSNKIACTYAAASGGARDLSAAVDVPMDATETASHFSLWDGATFRAGKQFTTAAETFANAGTARVTSAEITVADV